jgi:hypothetical protein
MTSVSIDNTIAKIIRDTRMTDSSYLADMYEWIPEAMRMLNTVVEMETVSKEIAIVDYQGKLPCGLVDLLAIEYQNRRLRYYTGIRPGSDLPVFTSDSSSTGFTAYPTFTSMPSGDTLDLDYVASLPVHTEAGYQLRLDYVSTNFKEGAIKIYYKTTPVDSRGLPLIIDHPDYKEAIYWWVRTKMIQSGYQDPVYGNDDRIAFQRWETYAARAIASIIYPSVDQKEAQLSIHVRFVPPVDYYDSFFNNTLPEPYYDGQTAINSDNFANPIGPLNNSADQ